MLHRINHRQTWLSCAQSITVTRKFLLLPTCKGEIMQSNFLCSIRYRVRAAPCAVTFHTHTKSALFHSVIRLETYLTAPAHPSVADKSFSDLYRKTCLALKELSYSPRTKTIRWPLNSSHSSSSSSSLCATFFFFRRTVFLTFGGNPSKIRQTSRQTSLILRFASIWKAKGTGNQNISSFSWFVIIPQQWRNKTRASAAYVKL